MTEEEIKYMEATVGKGVEYNWHSETWKKAFISYNADFKNFPRNKFYQTNLEDVLNYHKEKLKQ